MEGSYLPSPWKAVIFQAHGRQLSSKPMEGSYLLSPWKAVIFQAHGLRSMGHLFLIDERKMKSPTPPEFGWA